jgi:hypothetical protein
MELLDQAREARNKYQREWREKNRAEHREYMKTYRENNKDALKENTLRYWNKKASQ